MFFILNKFRFVILAADASAARSILVFKHDQDKVSFAISFFLKEIINILIMKYKFFEKSKILINNYQLDSNQKILSKDNKKIKLTEKELNLILGLKKKNGVNKSELLKSIWNYSSKVETHTFETNLYRLRKKIEKNFNDKNFIYEKGSFYYLS